MGRSIPSFRKQLLEIENIHRSLFKKQLLSKMDKQELRFLKMLDFIHPTWETHQILFHESVFMGVVFHNYKQLLQITKEDTTIDEDSIKDELILLLETKSEGKILFYRFNKKWHGFLYSLHKEDRSILLKMVLEVCNYDDNAINIINIQDSQSNIDYFFFLLSMILQQKRIDMLNAGETKNTKDVTLLDFMCK